MQPPEFWTAQRRSDRWLATALSPLGALYGAAVRMRRASTTPWRAPIPVICVGNIASGGQGKTPTALAIAERLRQSGVEPAFITRGYGGQLHGPGAHSVDAAGDDAATVGDEPLLLAACAPTYVAADRVAAAKAAVAAGARCIIMDDGLQNGHLQQDLRLVVIDGAFGFGNGHVLPAGPLREPPGPALRACDAIVLIGEDRHDVAAAAPAGTPILAARLEPDAAALTMLAGRRIFAFAGIGRPAKFFEMLRASGLDLAGSRAFPDHHPYQPSDLDALASTAASRSAVLVTTVKDAVRLPPAWRTQIATLPVTLVFEAPDRLDALLSPLFA